MSPEVTPSEKSLLLLLKTVTPSTTMCADLLRLVIFPHELPGSRHMKLFTKRDRELEAAGEAMPHLEADPGFLKYNFRCDRNDNP